MKVELLVNLKTGDGTIHPKGKKFTDIEEPLPEFIENILDHERIVKILDPHRTVKKEPEKEEKTEKEEDSEKDKNKKGTQGKTDVKSGGLTRRK